MPIIGVGIGSAASGAGVEVSSSPFPVNLGGSLTVFAKSWGFTPAVSSTAYAYYYRPQGLPGTWTLITTSGTAFETFLFSPANPGAYELMVEVTDTGGRVYQGIGYVDVVAASLLTSSVSAQEQGTFGNGGPTGSETRARTESMSFTN